MSFYTKKYSLKRVFLTISYSALIAIIGLSQGDKRWEIGAQIGVSNYQGDLVPTQFFTWEENNLAYGAYIKNYLTPNIGWRVSFVRGSLSGADANFDIRDDRLANFTTSFNEASLRFDFEAPNGEGDSFFKKGYVPYFFTGISTSFFEPNAFYGLFEANDIAKVWVDEDKKNLENQSTIGIPIGIGLKVQTASALNIGFELGYRYTFSDYLDGVSQAGNPTNNDSYIVAAINLGFRLGKKDSDNDGVSDSKDLCPNEPGKKELNGCPDSDDDGVKDSEDQCPELKGSVLAAGCPDADNDGIVDKDDKCPGEAGTKENGGCPDTDGDGVIDREDKCPEIKGQSRFNGCNDSDGDGVGDDIDRCPDEAGSESNFGCKDDVKDQDKDGVPDDKDDCPNESGTSANNGCPDSDGDGVVDRDDKCPTEKGLVITKGCPDSDEDGVADKDDKCPTVKGLAINGGCPEIIKEDKEILDLAVKNVNFDTGSANIAGSSFDILDKIVVMMNKYPVYSLTISGYSDNVGNAINNRALSLKRAESTKKYLVTKGIQDSRIKAFGFGEENPIASNDTKEGKILNRRVEFVLKVE